MVPHLGNVEERNMKDGGCLVDLVKASQGRIWYWIRKLLILKYNNNKFIQARQFNLSSILIL